MPSSHLGPELLSADKSFWLDLHPPSASYRRDGALRCLEAPSGWQNSHEPEAQARLREFAEA